jgi:uncharacterized protein YecT (DUF1311 family)
VTATAAWAGAIVLALLLPGRAAAGALEECYVRAATRLDVTPCLNAAKKVATDAMLEEFLAVSHALQKLESMTGRPGAMATLKQSQRDFERCLLSHCLLVEQSFASGGGAGQAQLACEVDLLRQRAAQLKPLAPTEDQKKE